MRSDREQVGRRGCLVNLLVEWAILTAAIALTAALLPGLDVSGGFRSVLWIAVVFAVVNVIVGPVVRLLALPFVILTFGLFVFVVNGALLGLTAALTDDLAIDGFLNAMLGAAIISLVSYVLTFVLGGGVGARNRT